ncbi:peptide synthase [Xenorhabdus mauleonii]|uniref:Peptide synthase n=1 Tax=Xenorhabdus mauleonii TaxID=351675 RepID=A0A1I3T915_9GAMM|nr:non-ribosomal peptide synthetase [Xenorhabdus mauleonii]PHM39368.1 peptide synthase [Xenorhabdus mauleonii]SFJ66261.1 non-ribosomal peptide synthase domain TIGR01720/amino acid adenylation domain-containing protein [Xenorhabdus mauleonii]
MLMLFKELNKNQVSVWVCENKLKLAFTGDNPPVQLIDKIKQRRESIVDFLNEKNIFSEDEFNNFIFNENIADENLDSENHVDSSTSTRKKVTAIFPATSLQQGFVYHHLAQPQDDAYRVQLLLDYRAHLDLAVYQQAWSLASLRFPILRTAFDWKGKILQLITTGSSINSKNFTTKDISQLAEKERNAAIDAIQQNDRTLPFDLSRPGLVRFTFIKQEDQLTTVLITLHHCIIDGWSYPILLQAVHEYYNELIQGHSPQVVVDEAYLATQQYYLDHKAETEAYWRERKSQFYSMNAHGMNDLSPLLSHRVDLAQIKTIEKPAEQILTIQGNTYEQLKETCREQGITLNVALQFAWNKLLHNYTGDEQTIVGTTVSGRDVPVEGIESSVGLYINTLPLMVQWEQTDSIAAVLQNIQQDIAALNSHSAVSLSSLQSNGERLFHSLLVFENYPIPAASETKEGIEHTLTFRRAIEKVDYPVLLMAYTHDNRLVIKFSYGEDWLTEKQAQRLLCQLERILHAVAYNPNQPHTSITLLSDEERHTLLDNWNQTEAPYPQDKTLQQQFEAQVAQRPDAIAVIFAEQRIRYGELNQRANRLAHHLIALGVRPDDRVALCLERSPEMVVGILAILKAGGAYVPLDPTYPAERLAYMLEDSGPVALLTQTAQAEKLSGSVPARLHDNTVLLDKQAALLVTLPDTNPDTQKLGLTSRHLAYVIYTSGSTGQPKGVMVEHRSVLRLINNNGFADIGPDDCIAHCANISFDAATWEVWSGLTHGARVLLIPEKTLLHPAEFGQCLSSENVSALFLTTALFNQYAGLIAPSLSGLRYVLFGGEQADHRSAIRLRAEHAPKHLLHVYGPTETTTFATTYEIPLIENEDRKLPIGRPISNTRIYILDQQGQPVPVGAAGEIHIGGDGVARGYLNRPELTAERFLPDPFSPQPEARMYKTGDLARWLPDGNIEYLSRNDFQVKLRGFRIELGEIENVLTSHPQVKQAVVIDYDYNGHKGLAAYLITEGALSDEILIKHLSDRLPEYMIPASFTCIETLPLTRNGKVDRHALPKPVLGDHDNYVAPRNALETQLCALWQDVLRLERIGIEDNFFRIGGDSIVSIQLVSKLRQAGFSLQVKSIFEAPTVAQLSQLLLQTAATEKIVAEQGLLNGEFDLLPIQQDFFNWNLPSPHHWNQAFMIRLPGDINHAAIEQVLISLTERHDILRANFSTATPDTTTPAGIIQKHRQCYSASMPSWLPSLLHCDVSTLNEVEKQQQLTQWQSGFNYSTGPLWQAGHLTGYADGSARLFFAFHHLIIDVVSWRIIAEDIRRLLQGEALPAKTSSYRQWVNAVHHYAYNAENQQREIAYWQQVVAGNSAHPVSGEASHHTLDISAELTDILLREANSGYQTEINDLLLSALTLALQAVFSSPVNHITLEGHGREAIDDTLDVSETVGWFTTVYPVRLTMQDDIAETIIHTKEMLRAVPNKGIGYGALRQAGYLGGELPAISFNYLGQLGGENGQNWSLTSDECGIAVAGDNHSHLLMNINGLIQAGTLQFNIGSRLPKAQTTVFITALEQALHAVITAGQQQAQSGGIKTPSDYGIEGISIPLLRHLQQKYRIEALYPATSLQQGFIYHHLSQPQDDAYRVQLMLDYHANLNITAYQQAWALASLRFPILRTAFNWDKEVLQIATEGASIRAENFATSDISHLPEKERNSAIDALQQHDRTLPFDFSQPGLIRFTVIKQHEHLVTVLITKHHAIIDGWSNPILLQTVHEYYNELAQGRTPQIEADHAYLAAQQYYLNHKSAVEAYWVERKAQFHGINDLSALLSHHVDLAQIKSIESPMEQTIILQGDIYQRLKKMSREHGITLNAMLQFAWHKLLHSYTGDEQTIVGTTVSGRDVPVAGIESSVGLYINTLPLMVQWDKASNIISVLQDIQKDIASLNSYSAVSLTNLQSDGERLFHSLLVFENYPAPVIGDNSAGGSGNEINNRIENRLTFRNAIEKTDYPLSLMAYEPDNSLKVTLSYGEEWITNKQAQRLLGQIERILYAVASDPYQPHTSVSFLSEEERHILLHTWNQTDVPYPQDKTLQQQFEIQAATNPDNVALIFEEEMLTYRQLNEKSNQLAAVIRENYLQQHHTPMQAGTPIALYLDRSPEMVVSILAVLKAGGAYVPISPEYPPERVQYILQDTDSPCVLTQQRHLPALEQCISTLTHQPALIATDDLAVTRGQPAKNLVPMNKSTDLAYIIYTSGTTGKPKGVELTHRNVINHLSWMQSEYPLNTADKVLQQTPYTFDASVWELIATYWFGASLVMPLPDVHKQPEVLYELIQKTGVTVLQFVPSMLGAFCQAVWDAGQQLPRSIRYVPCGGEALTMSHVNAFRAINGHSCTLINLYGPTETTIDVTHLDVTDDLSVNIPIGKAHHNTRLYVLTPHGELSPIGVPGELYIGGAGLARGYWNHPELTEKYFVNNPFATDEDKARGYTRLYRTGDRVRWLADGNLEYLGRNDFQIKIRGYRIELGEIETALSTHPQVKQAVVIDHEHQGNRILAAYLVAEVADGELSDESLIKHLSARLPEYMVPASFTRIDGVPLTLNGKLDRHALPEPVWGNRNNYVAPRNELENQLCAVWQEVLDLEQVGIEDNFFRIGGNSLMAIKLTTAMRNQLGVEIPLNILFNYKSISLLSEWLESGHLKSSLLNYLTPKSTAKNKLFMIHAANCGSEVYEPLANTLSDTYNCIGIDNYNLCTDEHIDSLQQIAQLYMKLMLTETSIDEPIRILGWSLGGQLAMEIAFQLERVGARDIQLFLLDTIMNNDEIKKLRSHLDMPSIYKKITNMLHEKGANDTYINKALEIVPVEGKIVNCDLSGKLTHSKVTLFKAGKINPLHKEGVDLLINQLLRKIPDNNIPQWINTPLKVILVEDSYHENIINYVSIINGEILSALSSINNE